MRVLYILTLASLAVAPIAAAQTTPTPAATAEAKFKAADKDNSGILDGAELEAFRSVLTQVDTNKDGKISRAEFMAGASAGHIK